MFIELIARFLGTIFAVLLAAYIVPGFTVDSFYTAAIVAVILGVLNVTIKPILILLTLPLTILTLGLFTFIINALLILIVSSFVEGFSVAGFVQALIGGAVIALIGWALHRLT